MRKPAKLWVGIFCTGALVLFAALLVTLFTRIPHGALTRVGQISEYQFEGLDPPPPIPMAVIVQSPIEEADVLVIGDSFSTYFAWQSELVGAGYKVATTHWNRVAPLCRDFAQWIESAGFRGRLILLESIEYLVPERLAAMHGCASMKERKFSLEAPPQSSPSQPPAGFALNANSRLFSGLITLRNTREIRQSHDVRYFDAGPYGSSVFSSPLENGCTEFSHRMCDKNLFLMLDRISRELTPADAEFMHDFAQRAGPLQVRWMMIPNKTTVYLDTGRAQGFASRARELGIGPDLFAVARAGRHAMRDLYWPNDNHWSMRGQLYFGDHMRHYVQDRIGAPSSKQ